MEDCNEGRKEEISVRGREGEGKDIFSVREIKMTYLWKVGKVEDGEREGKRRAVDLTNGNEEEEAPVLYDRLCVGGIFCVYILWQ